MAITMTVKKGGGGSFAPGWHKVTTRKASYGSLENGAKFIDVWFNEFPSDNFNMRMYAKTSKDGEEFAIANLFRHANAGILEVVDNDSGGDSVVKIDDAATNMVDKTFNIFLYKNDDGYYRVLAKIAPDKYEGKLDTIKENDVEYWKGKAEDYYKTWVLPNLASKVAEQTDDVPF